jgi:hypothetical protein
MASASCSRVSAATGRRRDSHAPGSHLRDFQQVIDEQGHLIDRTLHALEHFLIFCAAGSSVTSCVPICRKFSGARKSCATDGEHLLARPGRFLRGTSLCFCFSQGGAQLDLAQGGRRQLGQYFHFERGPLSRLVIVAQKLPMAWPSSMTSGMPTYARTPSDLTVGTSRKTGSVRVSEMMRGPAETIAR